MPFTGAVLDQALAERGDMPLPPYIASRRDVDEQDRTDYQTMFAREEGSVAAPTAGLHFTDALTAALRDRGIDLHRVTLHVGPGTFLPVKADDTSAHQMHPEWGSVSPPRPPRRLNATRRAGGRIVAVGSTSLRLFESAAAEDGTLAPFSGETALFITPGYRFRAVDAMLTNFHLPRSTLFMLVCAFCGLESMRARLCARDRKRLSVLFLRRCVFAVPMNEAVMPNQFSFRLIATDGAARTGEIATAHGVVRTPAFMPVGTQAAIKGVHHDDVRASGADIMLANTYHLMLRPGAERVAALGGLHAFMRWPYPILTDSGGFQVMSLAALRKVAEAGVTFRSHIDGAMVELSPERAVEVQILLGSDIAMQLDECVRLPADERDIERAMKLSLRWAERCKRAFERRAGRPRAVRHRAGRRRSKPARGKRCARSPASASTATPSAALPSARRPRSCAKWSPRPRRRCRLIGRAISWASARPRTFLPPSRAASTCSIACCRRATAATVLPSRVSVRSTSRTRTMPTIRGRSMRQSRCPAARDFSRAYSASPF